MVARVLPLLIIFFTVLNLPSCASRQHREEPMRGIASWYGGQHKGHKTASGEIFDPNEFTAAHRTLPFGTWVLVKNLKNSKEVRVRINDRGPYKNGRIIDLSRRAAQALGMVSDGDEEVELVVER